MLPSTLIAVWTVVTSVGGVAVMPGTTTGYEQANTESPGESLARASRVRAVEWVMSQQNYEHGWGDDTAHTMLALALADTEWTLDPDDLEARLINKEFELQLVLRLWKHHLSPPTTGHLALNVLALLALCRDPSSFHGKDLVAMLEHQAGVGSPFETAFTRLVVCSAGRRPRRRDVRELLDILERGGLHSIDTLSVVVMALHCAESHRHNDLSQHIDRAVSTLLKEQMPDGSFRSNLHTTALALQALISSNLGSSWNATLAQQFLVSHQDADGSFGRSLFDTNAVLPLLMGRTLLEAAQQPCVRQPYKDSYPVVWSGRNDFNMDKYDSLRSAPKNTSAPGGHYESYQPDLMAHNELEQNVPAPVEMINFTYIIWVGTAAKMNYNMTMTLPKNTSMYETMKIAAELDDRFEFSATHWGNGYYVHTLAGQKEKMAGFWFWLLYRLAEPPVPGVKPSNKFVSPTGVLETIPHDGDYMLFWYHKL